MIFFFLGFTVERKSAVKQLGMYIQNFYQICRSIFWQEYIAESVIIHFKVIEPLLYSFYQLFQCLTLPLVKKDVREKENKQGFIEQRKTKFQQCSLSQKIKFQSNLMRNVDLIHDLAFFGFIVELKSAVKFLAVYIRNFFKLCRIIFRQGHIVKSLPIHLKVNFVVSWNLYFHIACDSFFKSLLSFYLIKKDFRGKGRQAGFCPTKKNKISSMLLGEGENQPI